MQKMKFCFYECFGVNGITLIPETKFYNQNKRSDLEQANKYFKICF